MKKAYDKICSMLACYAERANQDTEIESLRAENEKLKSEAVNLREFADEIKHLRGKLDVAREAMEFYWPIVKTICCNHDDPSWCKETCGDYGKRLRKALAALGGPI